jgi:hypothetical protein
MFMRYSPERGHGPFDVRNLTQVLGPQHREVDSIFDSHEHAVQVEQNGVIVAARV